MLSLFSGGILTPLPMSYVFLSESHGMRSRGDQIDYDLEDREWAFALIQAYGRKYPVLNLLCVAVGYDAPCQGQNENHQKPRSFHQNGQAHFFKNASIHTAKTPIPFRKTGRSLITKKCPGGTVSNALRDDRRRGAPSTAHYEVKNYLYSHG